MTDIPSPIGPETGRAESDADLRAAAIESLQKKQAFRTHLTTYLLVNGLLFVIWLATAIGAGGGAWFPWFIFPMVGWGVGLAFHAKAVYGSGTTEADIQREMERLRQR